VASSVTTPAEAGASRIPPGVPALRAGQGQSFLWRRLHSLSGIIPVGTFIIEHFVSNAFATNGPSAYAKQVKFLTGLPFADPWLEIFGIYIPILFHAGYGIFIWWRGKSNVGDYKYAGNWFYTLQRLTGIFVFAYILYHTWYMRFSGVHLFSAPGAAYGKVQAEFASAPWVVPFYVLAIIAACWHFGYGIFLFIAKWGFVTGERARKRMTWVGAAIAVLFAAMGLYTIYAFESYPVKVPQDPSQSKAVEEGQYDKPQEHPVELPK